jgi:hypothetical protein
VDASLSLSAGDLNTTEATIRVLLLLATKIMRTPVNPSQAPEVHARLQQVQWAELNPSKKKGYTFFAIDGPRKFTPWGSGNFNQEWVFIAQEDPILLQAIPPGFAVRPQAWKEAVVWKGAPSDPPAAGVNTVLAHIGAVLYSSPIPNLRGEIALWTAALAYPLAQSTVHQGSPRKEVEIILVTLAMSVLPGAEESVKTTDIALIQQRAGI